MRQIVVIGATDYAQEIVAAATLAGLSVRAVYDDDASLWGKSVAGVQIRGPVTQAEDAGVPGVIAYADPLRRKAIAAQLNMYWVVVVHPRATFDRFTAVKAGSVVLERAVVQPGTRIGGHVIIGARSTIAHDCRIGDFAVVSQGVQLAGFVEVGSCTSLDVGAVAIPNVRIGASCHVAARSVVIRDLPEFAHVSGVPALPGSAVMPPLVGSVVAPDLDLGAADLAATVHLRRTATG